MKKIKLGKKFVGDGFPCFTIAEIGGLFQNFEEAKRLIDSAMEIGIDGIKFQTLEADTITTKKNYFDMKATGKISQHEIFKQFEPSKELQTQIVKYANDCGATIFSAPSHMHDLEFMQKLNLPIYKIGSDLACHIPLLKKIAELNKPIILSTGMCTLDEVRNSVNTILETGNDQLMLLHCVSDYPTKPEEANLNSILTMKREFNLPVGFSDHVPGIIISVAAVTLGANLIERHFRHPENSPSPDDAVALTKEEYCNLIDSIRLVEKSKGSGEKIPSTSEQKNLLTNRVSIIALKNIPKGTVVTDDLIDIRRPGTGIQPIYFESVIGKKAKMDINKEEPLTWNMLV